MIYDCFSFYNELDVLEIRLNTLFDVVDKFVLVEATRTHSNLEKPLYFNENKQRFEKFSKKIIHLIIDDLPEYKNSWTYENYQRNFIATALIDCKDDDTIIISDCDEIPRPETILKVKDNSGVTCLLQDNYYYFLNYLNTKHYIWGGGTKVCKYDVIRKQLLDESYVVYNDTSFHKDLNKETTMTKIRLYNNCHYVSNGGWHFSYIGGIEVIRSKFNATGHQELNTSEMKDTKRLIEFINSGKDIFGRKNHKHIAIPINASFPKYIIENSSSYDNLIYKDRLSRPSKIDKTAQYLFFYGKDIIKKLGGKPLRQLLNRISSYNHRSK